MRVLVLSQYYAPEPVEKVHDLAKGLVRRGHQVEVLTGLPCYPAGTIYPTYRGRWIHRETMDGVRVHRIPQLPDHSRSPLRRTCYYLSFMFVAALLGPLLVGRFDVILVYQAALPVGIAARFLACLRRKPYVLDVVDLWPESVVASGMLRSRVAESIVRRTARWVYEGAAQISVVTRGFQANLERMGVPSDKITVIENWMPSDVYKPAAPDPALAAREGLAGKFVVMYAGNMGAPQGLDAIIDAAALLRDEPQICFALVGSGTELESLREAARLQGLTNVVFLGRRPSDEMPSLYAIADVLLVHLKPSTLTDISIPSKTFAYMAVGKPVLMAVRGDASNFVRENGFGITAEPSNPQKIADAIRDLCKQPPEKRARMGAAGLKAIQSSYCGEVQIGRFETLLHTLP